MQKTSNQNLKNHLTEGSIVKALFSLAIPIVFANLLQTAYQLTDTFWVGRLGSEAVAAVSISFPLIFLIISLGMGLAMAGSILVSQFKGKEDSKAVNHIAGQTLLMVILASAILGAIGYLLSPIIVKLITPDVAVYQDAIIYLKISFLGMVPGFLYMIYQSLMRGVGEVKTPIYVVLLTVILNLFLDPLFIFGYKFIPAYGVSGAAVATLSTQTLAAIIGIYLLANGKYHIHINLKDLKPDFPLIKKMFKLGFPASIEHSTRALGMTIMTFLVSSFGTINIAAYGIGSRILSFVIIPAMGLSMATSTLVGQNTGAKKMDRVDKIVKLSSFISFGLLSIVGIIFFIFAQGIATTFIPNEPETILASTKFIKIMALSFGFIGLQMSLNGTLRGVGNTMASMMLSIISLWVLRFPLAYFLSMHTELKEVGIWLGFPIANFIAAIITIAWFMQGNWKKKELTQDIKLQAKTRQETIIEEGLNT